VRGKAKRRPLGTLEEGLVHCRGRRVQWTSVIKKDDADTRDWRYPTCAWLGVWGWLAEILKDLKAGLAFLPTWGQPPSVSSDPTPPY